MLLMGGILAFTPSPSVRGKVAVVHDDLLFYAELKFSFKHTKKPSAI